MSEALTRAACPCLSRHSSLPESLFGRKAQRDGEDRRGGDTPGIAYGDGDAGVDAGADDAGVDMMVGLTLGDTAWELLRVERNDSRRDAVVGVKNSLRAEEGDEDRGNG